MKAVLLFGISLFVTNAFGQQYELPSSMPREQQVKHELFSLSYNEAYEFASWAAYCLTSEQAKATGTYKEKFVEDPLISTGSASVKDYKDAGFIMGQLVPPEDLLISATGVRESFLTSNTVPHKPVFNKNIWKKLEVLIREWAKEGNTLYIACGPVITDAPFGTFGPNKISIPERYYKVVLDVRGERAIGFVFRNNVSSGALKAFAVSVDEVEKLTGIDFFTSLEDGLETKLESSSDFTKWNFRALEQ